MKSKTRKVLQVIFTFKEGGQQIANFEFDPKHIVTEQAFIEFAENAIKMHRCFIPDIYDWFQNQEAYQEHVVSEIPELSKLSGCIIQFDEEKVDTPKWWDDAHGKVYFEA